MSNLSYSSSPLNLQRRESRVVKVGNIPLGGDYPVRVQSMLTSDTREVADCVKETMDLVAAGCEIVRVTAQTRQIAENLEHIVAGIRAQGSDVPIVADIHFKPDAAMEAVRWVDKVRVNPGNYADKKKFEVYEYTDQEYADELARLREEFTPLVEEAKRRGVAMRIGTNHGSLSDRIMNRFGDTPLGMVESALEFARIARDHDYHELVFSMKASNPKVMVQAYRLLIARLSELGEDWNYPIHLGVTEAGDGEDGRIKSAIGIGSLLCDGIGDTIRVSLTEDAVEEVPVARALVKLVESESKAFLDLIAALSWDEVPWDPFSYTRRASQSIDVQGIALGGEETVRVFTSKEKWNAIAYKMAKLGDFRPEVVVESSGVLALDPRDEKAIAALNAEENPRLITVADGLPLPVIPAFRLLAAKADPRHPILLKDTLTPATEQGQVPLDTLLNAAMHIGSLLCDGIGDAILVQGEASPETSLRISYNILQAAGVRIFKTDYVACPGCGRTLYNLQETTQRIRAATGHLKGLRIAVMGCIVNGPGEMADADFGYVGGAPGKINLYYGKKAVKFNIPQAEAVDRLIDLIREYGRWFDPPEKVEDEEAGENS